MAFILVAALAMSTWSSSFASGTSPLTKGGTCIERIEQLARMQQVANWNWRKRSSLLRQHFHTGEEKKYMELLQASHDNSDTDNWRMLKGFSPRREQLLENRMVANGNHYIPAYFQFFDHQDTYSTSIAVRTHPDSEQGQEGLQEVAKWMSSVKNYYPDLERIVGKAFRAREDLLAMAPQVVRMDVWWMRAIPQATIDRFMLGKSYAHGRGKTPWDFEQFRQKELPFVEVIRPDGAQEQINFSSRASLGYQYGMRRRIMHHTFTRNYIEEKFKKSLIYERMTEQALMFKRLEYLHGMLSSKTDKTKSQQQLMRQIDALLSDSAISSAQRYGGLRSRKKFYAQNFGLSLKERNPGTKTLEGYKFRLPKEMSAMLTKSPLGHNLKLVLGGSIIATGAVTSFISFILAPTVESPWLQITLDYPGFWWNYFWLHAWGDQELRECAKVDNVIGAYNVPRVYSQCYKKAFARYTQYFESKERVAQDLYHWGWVDHPYRMQNEPRLQKLSRRLHQLFAQYQDEFRATEFNHIYTNYYSQGALINLDGFMKEVFIFEFTHEVPEVDELYDRLIESLEIARNNQEVENILLETAAINQALADQLVFYLEYRDKMAQTMNDRGIFPDGRTFEEVCQELGIFESPSNKKSEQKAQPQ